MPGISSRRRRKPGSCPIKIASMLTGKSTGMNIDHIIGQSGSRPVKMDLATQPTKQRCAVASASPIICDVANWPAL